MIADKAAAERARPEAGAREPGPDAQREPESVRPGVAEARRLAALGAPDHELAGLLVRHPGERDAILAELHPRIGNAGVDAVLRAGGGPMLALGPGGQGHAQGQAAPPKASAKSNEERERVDGTIHMLELAKDHLGAVGRPAKGHKIPPLPDETVTRLLRGWQEAVLVAQDLLSSALHNDKQLTEKLQKVYVAAVSAAAQRAKPDADFIQDHKAVIHHWAYGIAREDKGSELLDALPKEERRKLQVSNRSADRPLHDDLINPDVLKADADKGTSEAQPGNTQVRFGSNVPDKLHHLLENVVGRLASEGDKPLHKNTTLTLLLDLRPHGGPRGTFRFTYVDHRRGTDDLLVELVSTALAEGLDKGKTKQAEDKFDSHGFSVSGYASTEREALLRAVLLVPDAVLTPVDGAKFRRASVHPTDAGAGGEYDQEKHTVTMFDKAFAHASLIRSVGDDGELSDEAVRMVVHELGHAVDLAPLRKAAKAADKAHSDAPMEKAGTSASGSHWKVGKGNQWEVAQSGKKADKSAFRVAAKEDGSTRLTDYSDDGWNEYFAECFSYYMTDPHTLQSLRPSVYKYFAKHYPR